MNIYLGGAIDFADDKSLGLFKEVSSWIVESIGPNVVLFNPFSAFSNANKSSSLRDDEYVVRINNLALLESDLAVFIWSGALTFGVPIEIHQRVLSGGPILFFDVSGKPPGIYMRHFLSQVDGKITNTQSGLCEALRNFKIVESPVQSIKESYNAAN